VPEPHGHRATHDKPPHRPVAEVAQPRLVAAFRIPPCSRPVSCAAAILNRLELAHFAGCFAGERVGFSWPQRAFSGRLVLRNPSSNPAAAKGVPHDDGLNETPSISRETG